MASSLPRRSVWRRRSWALSRIDILAFARESGRHVDRVEAQAAAVIKFRKRIGNCPHSSFVICHPCPGLRAILHVDMDAFSSTSICLTILRTPAYRWPGGMRTSAALSLGQLRGPAVRRALGHAHLPKLGQPRPKVVAAN